MSGLEFRVQHRFAGGFSLDVAFTLDQPVGAIFGPSGSGKTTILRLIGGLLRPEAGRIATDSGRRLLVDTERRVYLPPEQRQVATVFQDFSLFPHLTVEKNLRYAEKFRRSTMPIDARRVIEVLELGPLLARFPRHLSAGESQRVALGRALLSHPRSLLLDEPVAALDDPLRLRVLAYLERALREWNIPALFVTHSQAEVRRLAQQVFVLQAGRLVAQGTPDEALGSSIPLSWSDVAKPVNLLKIDQVSREGDQVVGLCGHEPIVLPLTEPPAHTPLYVEFSPQSVMLSAGPVPPISARNRLAGVVRRCVNTGHAMFIAVDIGQIIWAEVTPGAAAELQLEPGRAVVCLIKTHSLRVWDD